MMSEAISSTPLQDPTSTKTTRTSQKKMSMNRRQDRRRLATFKINNGLAVRHIPTAEEVATFIQSIELNDVSKFGLVKLSNCVLDFLYTHPYRETEVITIIRLAALAKRDAIVNSLLVAQADPTVFCCQCDVSSDTYIPSNGCDPTVSLFVSERIRKIFKPLSVLFVRRLMDMKQSLTQHIQLLNDQNNTSTLRCQACLLSEVIEKSERNKGGCHGNCCLLLFESCQHVLCEACYWMHAVVWDDYDDAKGEDIVCPVCKTTSLSSSLSTLSITNNDQQVDSTSTTPILASSSSTIPIIAPSPPHDIATRSKSRYDQLAEDDTDTQQHKRFQFRAMTRNEAACVHLGIKQSHRDDELLKVSLRSNHNQILPSRTPHHHTFLYKLYHHPISHNLSSLTHQAAATGNRRRLQALVDIGIDINKTNEYGQGALFISTWLGHQSAAMFLIACGADVNQCDNVGVSVLSTGIASGSTLVVDALLRNPTTSPLSSSWCNITIQENQLCKPSVVASTEPTEVCSRKDMHVTCLIGNDVHHQGAGSIYIDNAFSDVFLDELEALFPMLPIAQSERGTGVVYAFP